MRSLKSERKFTLKEDQAMHRFWAMKTYLEWWNTFNVDSVIGIDQACVKQDYTSLSDAAITRMLRSPNVHYTEYIDRAFRGFSR